MTAVDGAAPNRIRFLRDGALHSLVGATGMIGVAGAMVVTSVSLFLADAVGATALMIGLFFAGRAAAEIATDLVVGVVSDRVASRRLLIGLASLCAAAGAGSYILFRNYYVLLICGAVFFGLGGATFSQLFAYTREFAEHRGVDAAWFNSALRAVTSFGWIVGPPLGLFIIGTKGFNVLYGIAAALFGLSAVLCLWGLPNVRKLSDAQSAAETRPFSGLNKQAMLLLAAIVVLLTINMMYQIDIALFVTKDLGISAGFTGLLLGVTSALEIPIMLFFGARAERIGKGRLVVLAALAAAVFFALLPFATTKAALLALQLANATFTAIVLSVPVIILQDAMPDRPGAASALYSSAFKAGGFLGGAITGVVTSWIGYTNVFWTCSLLAVLATFLLILGRRS